MQDENWCLTENSNQSIVKLETQMWYLNILILLQNTLNTCMPKKQLAYQNQDIKICIYIQQKLYLGL